MKYERPTDITTKDLIEKFKSDIEELFFRDPFEEIQDYFFVRQLENILSNSDYLSLKSEFDPLVKAFANQVSTSEASVDKKIANLPDGAARIYKAIEDQILGRGTIQLKVSSLLTPQ